MADVKIQDVLLIETPSGSNKMPVSDGLGLAKTISVDQVIGVHEAKLDPHTQYLEAADLAGYSLTTHNHSLANLTEKSYNSLTDKPTIPSVAGLLDETAHDLLDHTGLTGIPAAYSLPTASTTVLGGVKVDGSTVTITNGVISSTASGGGDMYKSTYDTNNSGVVDSSESLSAQYIDWNATTGGTSIANKPTIPSISGLLDEAAHDALDHTGLTGIPTQYTDELAQDAVGAAIAAGTQTGITVAYDDVNNKIDFTVTASGAGDVTGPASSVDSNFALFNGTTGKVIKDGGVKASDFATASHNHTSVYEPANANIQSHISSTSNQHPATSITNTPAGNISATTVQAAINELDTEKAAVTQLHDPVTVADSTSIDLTLTGQQISAAAIFGTTAGTISEGNHGHSGVYEPADATILKSAAIGVTVQAYDADLTSWAAIAPSAKQDTLVSGTNIKTINSTSLLGSGDISVLTNPLTTKGDLIVTADGTPARLAIGTNDYVLTADSTATNGLAWKASTSGFTNPMTASGDIIYGGTSGAATRLAKGTDGQVLTLASGLPSWAAASGGSLRVGDSLTTSTVSAVSFTGLSNVAYIFKAQIITAASGSILMQVNTAEPAGSEYHLAGTVIGWTGSDQSIRETAYSYESGDNIYLDGVVYPDGSTVKADVTTKIYRTNATTMLFWYHLTFPNTTINKFELALTNGIATGSTITLDRMRA